MICKLCDQNKKLIKAHVIPRWAFRYLHPENRGEPLIIVSKNYPRRSPTGIWDDRILCANCDGIIGKFDDYGKEVLLDQKPANYGSYFLIESVDTIRFRVFLLSVIWRCSISSRREAKYINLGQYENMIKAILIKASSNQNVEHDLQNFTIFGIKFGRGKLPIDLVERNMQFPIPFRLGFKRESKINCHIIYFPKGYKFFVKTDRRPFHDALVKVQVKGANINIMPWKDFQQSYEYHWMVNAVKTE
jgi:hypothetical protein